MSDARNMVEAFERLVDEKIAKALRGGPSTVPAEYIGADSDGKMWVMLPGATSATPVRRSSVETSVGDTVIVTVAGGMAVIDDNLTDKSAGVAGVAKVDEKATVAQETAVEAIDYATQASAAASSAQSSASSAMQSAGIARASADSAVADAARANDAATQAISDAADAADAADSAQESANRATYALADMEKVVGAVNWIAEHGEYLPTEDTAVDASKVYYTRSGSGTQGDPYAYSVVAEPKASELSTYYELHIDESVQNFINSHLWLTNAGLNLTVDRDGQTGNQRIHLGTVNGNMDTGVYVINEDGYVVSAFADGYSTFRDETGKVQASFGQYGGFIGPAYGGPHFVITSNGMMLYNNVGHECFSVTGGPSSTESYRQVVDVKAGYTLSDFVYAVGPGMQAATVSSVMVDGESVSFTTEPASAEQILPNGYSISTGKLTVILDAPVTGPARIVAEGTLPVPAATAVIGSPFASHVEIGNDGVEIGDGNGYIVCSITSDGTRIGRDDESNVEISGRSIEMSDADKCLLSISFDGLVNIVNSGGNPSVSPYSEQDLIGIISMLNSGYTVSGTSVLDPEGNATLYTVRDGVVNNRYGESVHSPTKYIYYNDVDLVFEDATRMGPQVEVEAIPTVVSFGDASVRAKDGRIQIDSLGVAEGVASTASGMYSHAQNVGTTAASYSQTAIGKYNVADANDTYAFIIGNGTDDSHRSNAFEVDWDGNVVCNEVNGLALQSMGEIREASGTESVETATNRNVASIRLPPGTWLVNARLQYPNNSTGRRAAKLSMASEDSGSPISSDVRNAVSGAVTHVQTERVFAITDSDVEGEDDGKAPVYLVAWQNSGSTLSCAGNMQAVRLSPAIGESYDGGGGGGGGTSDYADLTNKPSIEGVTLVNDKTFPDLGLFIDAGEQYPQSDDYALTTLEINALWNNVMA